MAKSSKFKAGKSKIDQAVTDAVEAAEDGPVEDTREDSREDVAESNVVEDAATPDNEDGDADSSIAEDAVEESVAEDPIETPEVVAQPSAPQSTGGGYFPLALGGFLAGVIGYAIATYYPLTGNTDDLDAQLAAQADQIAQLEAQLADQPAPDLSALEALIEAVRTDTADQIGALEGDLEGQFATIDTRLIEVEKRPNGDGTLSDTALDAYQRELEQLRAELDASQANVMSAAAQAEADLAAARAEAELLEKEALAAAEAAAARAALNRVAAAVETGAPFASAIADLPDDVPAALSAASETGVATTASLVDQFPAAARAALATARAEGVSDDAGGLGGFLRSQFDVRSTSPKEGSGPDAVLSRAEAAVKEGRVADALAELEALPEVARAELTDWTALATERADVLDAIATLSETYN